MKVPEEGRGWLLSGSFSVSGSLDWRWCFRYFEAILKIFIIIIICMYGLFVYKHTHTHTHLQVHWWQSSDLVGPEG